MAEVDRTGRLAVSFYALRSEGDRPRTDLWVFRSGDRGRTFDEARVDGPFDLSRAPSAGGLFLGDYTGLSAAASGFVAMYAVTTVGVAGPTEIRAAVLG
jgi:hypothetical protein